jgi:hypothetical protein
MDDTTPTNDVPPSAPDMLAAALDYLRQYNWSLNPGRNHVVLNEAASVPGRLGSLACLGPAR